VRPAPNPRIRCRPNRPSTIASNYTVSQSDCPSEWWSVGASRGRALPDPAADLPNPALPGVSGSLYATAPRGVPPTRRPSGSAGRPPQIDPGPRPSDGAPVRRDTPRPLDRDAEEPDPPAELAARPTFGAGDGPAG
jgi:hypothetical protein